MKPITPINIDCIPEKEYLSPEFKLIVDSKSNGLFIYETSDPSVFTVDQDGIVTITGPGKAYIIIKQLESENFGANQIDRVIIVNKSKPPITFSGPSSLTLDNTPVSARILKIETIPELIQNVFSVDENILKINRILNDTYELVPQTIGTSAVIVTTKDNYYFNKNSERFAVEIKESFKDSSIVLNINTFQSGFKHDALKEIDILTSNSISDPTNNSIGITFQQESRGYQFDVPILNLDAKNFINSVGNFDKEILCCAPQDFLDFSVEWNFNNNIVHDFFPYEDNINDRPRINIFRSDGKYIEYVSGGFNFLKIPQNSGPDNPNAYIYQKWGNRNTGIKQFRVPNIQCLAGTGTGFFRLFDPNARANFWDFTQDPNNKRLSGFRITYTNGSITADWGDGSQSGINSNISYSHRFVTTGLQLPSLYYGVDFFTREDLLPSYLYPPFISGWTSGSSNPGEIKYQYLFVGNYQKDIVINLKPSLTCFIQNYGTTLSTSFANCSGQSNPFGIWVSGINTNARKRCFLQLMDAGQSYSNGFINSYDGLLIWDGQQDGTLFNPGDTLKFLDNLFNRINIESIYRVSEIVPNPDIPNFPNSQALVIQCLESSSSSSS